MKSFKEHLSNTEDYLEVSDLPPVMEKRQIHSEPHDPPPVLVMKRKSIRLFPDGRRVALYYVDKINKYVTIPYSDMQWASGVDEELSPHDTLKMIIDESNVGQNISEDIFKVYNKLNETNKKRFLEMAEEDFNGLMNFVKKNK